MVAIERLAKPVGWALLPVMLLSGKSAQATVADAENCRVVRARGFEPPRDYLPLGPQPSASASSATPAHLDLSNVKSRKRRPIVKSIRGNSMPGYCKSNVRPGGQRGNRFLNALFVLLDEISR